jgi:hypothetical protein
MIGETLAFFRTVFEKDLSLTEFIDSDWTMLNARLASHYGMSGPGTDEFQKVRLKPEHHRGGLLTQAAILSLTSDGQRHRPIHRGVWVSETILGITPPPPPAIVDPIEPTPVDDPKATLRMRLDAHQQNPSCAGCHQRIDPLGFAFENFDAIGSWRTVASRAKGTGQPPEIDASGTLPNGRTFADADEFKQLLLDDIDSFCRSFVRKLAVFGLRRAVSVDDEDEIATIADAAKNDNYRVRSLVRSFVLSDLFRSR